MPIAGGTYLPFARLMTILRVRGEAGVLRIALPMEESFSSVGFEPASFDARDRDCLVVGRTCRR